MFWKQANGGMQQRRCGIRGSNSLLIVLVMLGSLVLAPLSASAEWYADPYLGGAFTSDEDVDTKIVVFPVTNKDVEFNASFTLGGRAGYWFEGLLPGVDYGAGLDIFYFAPDIDFQGVITTFGPDLLLPINVSVVGIGFDLLRFRLPLQKSTTFPHGRLQPYVSLGPFVSIILLEDLNLFAEETDASIGVKLGTGVRFMIRKYFGLFGEYRFTHTSAEVESFGGLFSNELDINSHHTIFGATFAF